MTKKSRIFKMSAILIAIVMLISTMSMLLAACGSTGVKLDQTELVLYVGDSKRLTATAPGDAEVEWTTSNAEVATVRRGTVTAVGEGKATITAKIASGDSATCEVTVKDRTVSIDKTSASLDIFDNPTVQLTATASDGGAVSWSSDDDNIASVNSDGLVTAQGIGKATITASRGTATASCEVTVTGPEDYYKITKATNAEVIADPGVWHYHADGSQGNDYEFDGSPIHVNNTASVTLTTFPDTANSKFFYFRYQPTQVEVGSYYTIKLNVTISADAKLRIGSKGANDKFFAQLEAELTADEKTPIEYVGYKNTSEPFSIRINTKLTAPVEFAVELVEVVEHDGENLPEYHEYVEGPTKNYEEIGQDDSEYDLTQNNNAGTRDNPGKWYYNVYTGSTVDVAHYNNGTITLNYSALTSNNSSNDQLRYRPEGLEGTVNIKVEFTVTSNIDANIVLALTDVTDFKSSGWTSKLVTAGSTVSFSLEIGINENQIIFIQVRASGADATDVEFTFSDIKMYKELPGEEEEDPNNPDNPDDPDDPVDPQPQPDDSTYQLNPNGNGDGSKGNVCANAGTWFYMIDNESGVTTEQSTSMTNPSMENGTLTWTLTKMTAKGYYLRYQPNLEVGTSYKISFDVVINRTGDTIKPRSEGSSHYETKTTTAGETLHIEFTDTVVDGNPFAILLNVNDASEENPVTLVISNIIVTAV